MAPSVRDRDIKGTPLGLSVATLERRSEEIRSKFELATSEQELMDLSLEIDVINGTIDSELNKFILTNQHRLQQDISGVELHRAKLSDAIKASGELIKVFSNSNDLGNSLTFRLKAIDKELGRVNEASDYVTMTKLLKNNINQAVYAFEHNDLELTANCIHTINTKIPPELIHGKYASSIIPSTDIPELPQVTIDKLTTQLTEIFKTKFNEAATKKNISELTKYFQLFPLISQEEAGLICYSKFICQIITDTLRSLIHSIASNAQEHNLKTGLYSRSSMQLFENISMMLSQHSPLIKRFYSSTYPNATSFVITKIQHEIDSQIGLITDTFYDENRISKTLQDIGLYKYPILASSTDYQNEQVSRKSFEDNELVTIVEAGDLFNEFASILNYWSLYCKFIAIRYWKSDSDKLQAPKLIEDSTFTKKVMSKYLPAFESIVSFYFKRSLEKAITIEELPPLEPFLTMSATSNPPDQTPCLSVIEDFSLVLNSCLRAVIDSGQLTSVKTFVTEAVTVIKANFLNGYVIKELNENLPRYNSYLSLIDPKLKSLSNTVSPRPSRGSTPAPEVGGMAFFKGAQTALGNVVGGASSTINTNIAGSGLVSNNPKLVKFIIQLNTIAVGQEYMTKIVENIIRNDASYVKNCFAFGDDSNIIRNILKLELLDPFISTTNKIIQESLILFYNQTLKTRILSVVSEFLSDSSESNYMIYSAGVLNDNTLIVAFMNEWRSLIRPYKQVFHHDLVFTKLMRLVILNLANIIEKRLVYVLNKFGTNELGALKLEKDVSSFISEVCEDNYELREKFVRVTQIVLLVGMDDEEYDESINSFGNNGEDDAFEGINWVLTPAERNQYRKFRV